MKSKYFDEQQALLLYDGECPFCAFYVRELTNLRRIIPNIELKNARDADDAVVKHYKKKYDLNEGFLLVLHGKEYYGHAAINAISLLKSGTGIFAKVIELSLSSRFVARVIYPVLVTLRKIYLFIIGKEGIKN